MTRKTFRKLAPVAGALLLGACIGGGDEPRQLVNPDRGGELFARYVSLGNSITAGFQSGGINDSTQRQAYPVLLANRAGAFFNVPFLNRPGCPPPFLAPLGTTGRVGGATSTATTCALRANPSQFGPVQNLAVPGATIGSLGNNNEAANALTSFILGGRTQLQAMIEAQPTLVSVWIGNNDALGVIGGRGTILPGDTAALTSVADFQTRLNTVVAAVEQTPAAQNDAVIMIGVVDPVITPIVQPGAFFFLAATAQANGTRLFQGKPVNANCSPVNALGQPNPLSGNLVNFQIVGTQIPEINCGDTAPLVINAAERTAISNRVTAFNQAMQGAASAAGYTFVNPNQLLAPFINERTATTNRTNRVRKCQDLATATTPAQLQAAVANTCPVTGATAAPNFFGSLFTFDGVHPSLEAHQIVAGALADAINAKFGTSI
jgi:lysophospholipase L1-like esterase